MREDKLFAGLGIGAFLIGFFLCFLIVKSNVLVGFSLMLAFISEIWICASLEVRIEQLRDNPRGKKNEH